MVVENIVGILEYDIVVENLKINMNTNQKKKVILKKALDNRDISPIVIPNIDKLTEHLLYYNEMIVWYFNKVAIYLEFFCSV